MLHPKSLSVALVAIAGMLPLADAAASALELEEIIVTARKRAESLQDTPLSIRALGQFELEQRNITTLGDLTGAVPNLVINSGISRNNAGIFIRGIGQGDRSVTFDPGVGLYIDGVYRARMNGAMLELLDIERIEVLRGPQGTLFGRNTIGGAMNVLTTKPADEFGLRVKVGVGNYDLISGQVMIDVPLIPDRLLSRLSVGYTDRDGVTKNVLTRDRWDDKNFFGIKLDLRYLATDDLSFDLAIDRSRRRQESNGAQCTLLNPNAQMMYVASLFGLDYAGTCEASSQLGERRFSLDYPSRDDGDELGFSLTATWDVNDQLAVKSITSWRKLEWALNETFDGTHLPIYDSRNPGSEQKQWSQEFQFQGEALDGHLKWTTGLYAFREEVERPAYSDQVMLNRFAVRLRKTDNKAYAVYGQGTYDFSDAWSLTAGIRYTYEKRKFINQEITLPSGAITDFVKVGDTFDAVTPMLSLAWHPWEDLMLYTSWAQGYKSGGFNSRANVDEPESLEPYDEETVDTYEIGVKSSWFQRRLTLNGALFYSDYEDIQQNITAVSSDGGPVSVVRNAGKARVQGIEIDLDALLTANWRLRGSYGYTDAKYKVFRSFNPSTLQYDDLSSLEFPNTPKNTVSLSLEWVLPIHIRGLEETTLQLDYNHADSTYNNVTNTESIKRRSLDLFNAQLTFAINQGNTRVMLWGKNLTNQIYYRSGFELADSFGIGQRFFSEPRTYGVTLSHEL